MALAPTPSLPSGTDDLTGGLCHRPGLQSPAGGQDRLPHGSCPRGLPIKALAALSWAGEAMVSPGEAVCWASSSLEPPALACTSCPPGESPEPPTREGRRRGAAPASTPQPCSHGAERSAVRPPLSGRLLASPSSSRKPDPKLAPWDVRREHAPLANLISMSLSPEFTQLKLGSKGKHFSGSSSTPKGSAQLGRIGKD